MGSPESMYFAIWSTVGCIRTMFTWCTIPFAAATEMASIPTRHRQVATKANHGFSRYLLSPHVLLVGSRVSPCMLSMFYIMY